MSTLAYFLQRKMIWPLVTFLGIVTSACIIVCVTIFFNQEIENRNLVLERIAESLNGPIALGSYVEIKSRLLSHNNKFSHYCLDYFSLNFQTNLCSPLKNFKKIELNSEQSVVLYFSWKPFIFKALFLTLLIIFTLLSLGLVLLRKAKKIATQLNDEVLMIYNDKMDKNFNILEFKNISDQFLLNMSSQSEIRENETRAEMAKQVAHDIRSPLAALHMITDSLDSFPENERILARHAIQRINDIANELLQKGNQEDAKLDKEESEKHLNNELVPALVDIILSEKRMQYREFSGLIIEVDLKDSFGAFSMVNAKELKRVISNLVNNSFDAFKNHIGKITVSVRRSHSHVIISVIDNGSGIPADLIKKIGQTKFSHGKENSKVSGSGLGVYHAKQTIERFGGELEIESTEGVGTRISIKLILAEPPPWFSSHVDLIDKTLVVSLDDDFSIHQIWKNRLNDNIIHKSFQSGLEFEKYINENANILNKVQFLVDFELLNQNKTGLDLIEELGIAAQSILVTSRYDDENIQKRAAKLGLKILPKSLAVFVPIQIKKSKSLYDLVLLDNDDLVRMTWEMKAKRNRKAILCVSSISELRARLFELDSEVLFFIDVHLSDDENGEQFSKELFDLGFNNLYLATGYNEEHFSHLSWIKGVVGKSPPLVLQ